jgi:hypothetical protein
MTGIALHLDLSLPPEWSRIDPTREAVGLLVLAMFGDDDLRDALAMVSEELLENAIKYCRPDSTVSISIRHEDDDVVVSVTNAVEEGAAHLEVLQKRLDWMRRFPSAAEAYAAAIGRVYERGAPAAGAPVEAGLGIVRIAYEGRCAIDLDLSSPGQVTVHATCARPGPASSAAPPAVV